MAAAPNDLVTLSEAYAWLGEVPGSDDAGLQITITAVSALIATWCSRNFARASFSETYDGTGSRGLTLRNWPVVSVESLAVDGVAIPPAASARAPGFRVADRRLVLSGYALGRGLANVEVAYTAGYATIPADLKMACLEWLTPTYRLRGEDRSVTERRAGDTAEKYGAGLTHVGREVAPMPPSVFAVLSQYRDVVPA